MRPKPAKPKSKSGRESIESFVVVFVAFLVWSLEAEGFVIPTGSMATTLMGRHKEIVCPQCGERLYGERRSRGRFLRKRRQHRRPRREGNLRELPVRGPGRSGTELFRRSRLCDETRRVVAVPVGSGMPTALKRWDVTVFKLPEEPEVRYIKRLVGMPNEVVRIEGGDLWMRPVDSLDFPERLRRHAGSPAGDADARL